MPKIACIVFLASLSLMGCQSPSPRMADPVIGTIREGNERVATQLVTEPTASGGARLSTIAGRGERAVTLSPTEVDQLAYRIEQTLGRWPKYRHMPPFQHILMLGFADYRGKNPFTIELLKRPGEVEPVFLITLAYSEFITGMELDRGNARQWKDTLKAMRGR